MRVFVRACVRVCVCVCGWVGLHAHTPSLCVYAHPCAWHACACVFECMIVFLCLRLCVGTCVVALCTRTLFCFCVCVCV